MQSPVVFKGLWDIISFLIKASAFFECHFYSSKKRKNKNKHTFFVHAIFTENSNLLKDVIRFKVEIGQDLYIHKTLFLKPKIFTCKTMKSELYVLHCILSFSSRFALARAIYIEVILQLSICRVLSVFTSPWWVQGIHLHLWCFTCFVVAVEDVFEREKQPNWSWGAECEMCSANSWESSSCFSQAKHLHINKVRSRVSAAVLRSNYWGT